MEEKKKAAVLKATRKLIETKTPEEDIVISLKELGVDEDEARQLLKEAGEPEEEQLYEAKKKAEEQPAEKQEEKRQQGFLEGILGKKTPEPLEKKEKQEKPGYLPKLRKGGREKVREIIEESPLDKKEEKKTRKTVALEARAKTEKTAAKEMEGETESFGMSLESLEKQLEKGTKTEDAPLPFEQKKEVSPSKDKEAEIIILIIPNREYSQGMSTLLRKMDSNYGKILYVNLNELYSALIQHLRGERLGVDKFFFVDAITLTSDKTTKKHDNCIFVSSPNALIELSLAITQALNTQKLDALVFDSLSTLLIYENEGTVTKFIHSLIGKIKAAGIDAYFTALEGDSQNESIKDLSMFVDRVNTITELELGELGFTTHYQEAPREKERPVTQELYREFRVAEHPSKKELRDRAEQSKVISSEMSYLRKRLDEMQKGTAVEKSLEDLKAKMGKIDSLASLQEQVSRISEKLEAGKEAVPDKALLAQVARLEEKIDSIQRKSSDKDASRAGEEVVKTIDALKQSMSKAEDLRRLQEQVNQLGEKLEKRQEKPVDVSLIRQIGALSGKIESLESHLEQKIRRREEKKQRTEMKKELSLKKKQLELEQLTKALSIGVTAPRTTKGAPIAHVTEALEKKKEILSKAYRKGFLSKKTYEFGKKKIGGEKKRLEHSRLVEGLENKLNALNEAYESGVISRESYLKGKARIEKLLKK